MPTKEPQETGPGLQYEIEPALEDELLDYPGKWVMITRSELIAVGDTAEKVRAAALALGRGDATLYHVREASKLYF